MTAGMLGCMLAVGGCGSSESPPQDLAVANDDLALAVGDLGPADLSFLLGPLDLAGWCVGTTLAGVDADGGATTAGECAREYFLQLAACFRPAGACGSYTHNSGFEECWDDGAVMHLPGAGSPYYDAYYYMKNRVCLSQVSLGSSRATSPYGFCVSTSTSDCTSSVPDGGGQFATLQQNGVFTCPDGTTVSIDLHGCPALNELLTGSTPCSAGSSCTFEPTPPF